MVLRADGALWHAVCWCSDGHGARVIIGNGTVESGAAITARAGEACAVARTSVILIVDEDASILASLAKILRQDGHELWTASTTREALGLVRARAPDLVLIDLDLTAPDADLAIRELAMLAPGAAIIAMTSHADPASRMNVGRLGASQSLTKPFGALELRECVARVLGPG